MNDNIIRCSECDNSILEYKGRSYFAFTWFDCYECEKCGNKIVLKSENQEKSIFCNENTMKMIDFNEKVL